MDDADGLIALYLVPPSCWFVIYLDLLQFVRPSAPCVWIKLRVGVDLIAGCALSKVLSRTGTVLCVLYPVHKL